MSHAVDDAFLRIGSVEKMVGLKKTAIYDRIKTGSFPRQIRLGATVAVWRRSEIMAWMDRQAAA